MIGRQTGLIELIEDKGIDRVLGSGARRRRVIDGLDVSPVGLGPLVDYGIAPIFLLFVMKLNLVFGWKGNQRTPNFKDGDLFIGKFAFGGI